MPQEFIITRCYTCQHFQVHQIRRDSKFTCKICGAKQSKRKIYGQGNAKDCRVAVQRMNMEENSKYDDDFDQIREDTEVFNRSEPETSNQTAPLTSSKWCEYLETQSDEENTLDNSLENIRIVKDSTIRTEHCPLSNESIHAGQSSICNTPTTTVKSASKTPMTTVNPFYSSSHTHTLKRFRAIAPHSPCKMMKIIKQENDECSNIQILQDQKHRSTGQVSIREKAFQKFGKGDDEFWDEININF